MNYSSSSASTGGTQTLLPSCEVCKAPEATKKCGQCRVAHYCSKQCQIAHWPAHKTDCKTISESTKELQATGYIPLRTGGGDPFPVTLDPAELLAYGEEQDAIYAKYGVTDPPTRSSTMNWRRKVEMFLEILTLHDIGQPRHRDCSIMLRGYLNRRYNNTYKHAVAHFNDRELKQLHIQMKSRRIGPQASG